MGDYRPEFRQQAYGIIVTLLPCSNDGKSISSLDVKLDITAPPLHSGDILLSLRNEHDNTPSLRYGEDTISASDKDGRIPLVKEETRVPGSQSWSVQRAICGQYCVYLHAIPREVDEYTPIGARVDLRRDQGGLQGAGMSFIPLPHWSVENKAISCPITVQWDLLHVSNTTRAIWTFGEGPEPVEAVGNIQYYIWSTQFMVGPVLSYPERGKGSNGNFGFYWFGADTPQKITSLGSLNEDLFRSMADFFEPDLQGKEPYRVFVRRSSPARGLGGTGLTRSFVLEYDNTIDSTRETFLIFLLSHEMVHNWLLMDNEEEGYENGWYIEGIRIGI
jgi:hypothetical protein